MCSKETLAPLRSGRHYQRSKQSLCILVGVYDKRLRKAYLIQEDSAVHNRKLSEFISTVRQGSNPKDLIAKIRGGQTDKNDPQRQSVEESGEVVMNALKKFFHEGQIYRVWIKSYMEIDAKSGKVRLSCY